MRRFFLLLLAALPLSAHMVSISSGDMRIEEQRAEYELRMPLYELEHVDDPERELFERLRFSAGGADAELVSRSCREDDAEGVFVCNAVYQFPEPVDELEVESRLPAVTVPNHVHLFRVAHDDRIDRAVLDLTFPRATLRFRPPTAFETAVTEMSAGAMRAIGGAAQLLFLASLALAARSRRELVALTAMFILGEALACLLLPYTGWQPGARFIEAAAALTIAYLAVEILLLPQAGSRWLVVAVLGIFHGLYFELFISTSEYSAVNVLAGMALAEVALVALFAFLLSKVKQMAGALRPVQASATVLLVVGMIWFLLRLRG